MALLLGTDDTKSLVNMKETIEILDATYRDLAKHEAVYRPRSDMVLPLRPGEDYWLATMEGASRSLGVAAIRIRSDRYSLPGRKWARRPGLFCGLVLLYDIETGELLAIMNDGYLQVMRVAATDALGGRYLARPESRILGIIGSGWQARDHLRAFACLFSLESVKVFSPNPAHREAFKATMEKEVGLPITTVASAREAVAGSDIVATCTRAEKPVLDGDWIEPGTYVSAIKYFREIGAANARGFDIHAIHPPDYGWLPFRAGTPEEQAAGCDIYDLYQADELPPGVVPFHEIVAGNHPGRTRPEQRTLLNDHCGMGIQFAALGRVVYDRARERGLGHELPSEWFLQNITT